MVPSGFCRFGAFCGARISSQWSALGLKKGGTVQTHQNWGLLVLVNVDHCAALTVENCFGKKVFFRRFCCGVCRLCCGVAQT